MLDHIRSVGEYPRVPHGRGTRGSRRRDLLPLVAQAPPSRGSQAPRSAWHTRRRGSHASSADAGVRDDGDLGLVDAGKLALVDVDVDQLRAARDVVERPAAGLDIAESGADRDKHVAFPCRIVSLTRSCPADASQ